MSDAKDKNNSPPPAGRTLAKMTGGAQIQPIVPTSLGECFALSELIFKTGLSVPRDVDSPQKLCVILLKGMELGLPPMAAIDSIGIINGRTTLYGDGIPSLLWSRGFKVREWYTGEDNINSCVAHCEITRPEGDKYTFSYGAQDAKDNGLWDTREKDNKGNPNKSPWFKYRKRMLRMRCRGWLARDCAADVLKGIPIYEEQADIDLERGEYREVKRAALEVPADIPDEAVPVSEAEGNQDALLSNPQQHVEELEAQLRMAATDEQFDEFWEAHEALVEAGRLPRAFLEEAEAIYDRHGKRFGRQICK